MASEEQIVPGSAEQKDGAYDSDEEHSKKITLLKEQIRKMDGAMEGLSGHGSKRRKKEKPRNRAAPEKGHGIGDGALMPRPKLPQTSFDNKHLSHDVAPAVPGAASAFVTLKYKGPPDRDVAQAQVCSLQILCANAERHRTSKKVQDMHTHVSGNARRRP
jgi:hypothetical protein